MSDNEARLDAIQLKTAEEVEYIIHERFDGETRGKVAHARVKNSLTIVGASPTPEKLTVWKCKLEENGGAELLCLYEKEPEAYIILPYPNSVP